MIDNDQSTIIEAPEVYKSIPTHFPSKNQRQKKNVDFDTFDVHVMTTYTTKLAPLTLQHIGYDLVGSVYCRRLASRRYTPILPPKFFQRQRTTSYGTMNNSMTSHAL